MYRGVMYRMFVEASEFLGFDPFVDWPSDLKDKLMLHIFDSCFCTTGLSAC